MNEALYKAGELKSIIKRQLAYEEMDEEIDGKPTDTGENLRRALKAIDEVIEALKTVW